MKEKTVHGGEAAARLYFETLDFAFRTGDTAPLEPLFADVCATCRAQVQDIERVYGEGGHYEGGQIKVTSAQSPATQVKNPLPVIVTIVRASGRAVRGDGGFGEQYGTEGKEDSLAVALQWNSRQWKVATYRYLQGTR